MANDYGYLGALSSISEGAGSFLNAYQTAKNMKHQQQMAEITAGVTRDADGNLVPGELMQQQRKLQGLDVARGLNLYDAGTAESQQRRTNIGTLSGAPVPADMPGTAFDSQYTTLLGDKMKADAMAKAAQNKSETYGDKNSITAGKDYEDRTKTYKQTQDDVARLESLLTTKDKNGKPLITAQQLGDANLAMSRIFSPGHQSDSTVAATEYTALPAKWAKAVQDWTANPQDTEARAIIEHIIDQGHHIANVSNQNALKELDDLDSGYFNLQNPATKKTAQSKSAQLRGRYSKHYAEVGQSPGLIGGAGGGKVDPSKLSREEKIKLLQGQ